MPGLSQDKKLFPITGGNPLKPFAGNQHFRSEELGRATVNGIECARSRLTITVENQPTLRYVVESCLSQTLGLLMESTSSGPEGEAHLIVDRIQHGEPPSEVFSPPANYTITDVPFPQDGTPPSPPR